MEYELYTVLFLSGLLGGLLSGLVGIGGGIIMFPLLLYVPPAFGLGALSIKAAASITSVQSLFGALTGTIAHHRHRRVYWPLARDFGGAMTATSLLGSIASSFISGHWILVLFAVMAVIAALLMLFPRPEVAQAMHEETAPHYSRPRAWMLGALIGVCAGVIGQGGGFLFVPVLMAFLGMPLRIAIGTALAVGVASSVAVVLGRIGTAQIPWLLTAITVSGGIIGAQTGSELSQRIPRRLLRGILAAAVIATAVKMLYDLLVG
ncbi:MAG: sulfite exporter TauE/SafE family protein [Hydrogenophilales bacterium]|nr:sulfite exporter TauE/SafE family protein [Hydrogenophilales bacterium]